MIEAMKGTEPPAAASGLPARSAEALPRADEAGVVLPRKCSGGASNGSKVGENVAVKNVFRRLWSQIVACRRFRKKRHEQEGRESQSARRA